MSGVSERGVSTVAGGRRWFKSKRSQQIAYVLVGFLALLMFGMGVNSIWNFVPNSHPDSTGSNVIGQSVPTPIAARQELPPKEGKPAIVDGEDAKAQIDYVKFPATVGQEYYAQVVEKKEKPAPPKPVEEAEATTVDFKPSTIPGAKAGKALRMTYVMRPGFYPCILDVAMDSTLAGAIECHLANDVLSQDHVILLPANTQVMGTYKANSENGQARLFSFVGNAITKEGIPVPLNSEVSDGMGRAGIDGEVDHHLMERFGAALALTALDAAAALGNTALSKAGSTNLNINSGGGTGLSGVANQILQSTINMRDTIYVQPGKQVMIVIDHPIDFGDAIKVTPR